MKDQFELLAPGGDLAAIKAAIAAGADAVYCGLGRFNARNRAENLTFEQLKAVLPLAHQHGCKIFITLNIILLQSELNAVVRLLNQLVRTEIDGVIIQDLGLGYILKHLFPTLDVHASTQLNTHNRGQISLLKQLGCSRVNLSRELNIDEIKPLAQFGREHDVLMEVFVHGSYCIGFSGLCYMSSVRNGASGNRGRCSQPCRDTYQTTAVGVDHPLNMKDNSAYLDVEQLADAGVYSLKVEGRIKKPHYVYTVVQQWRKQLDNYSNSGATLTDTNMLYKVFNRDFSDGYLQGNIARNMFIDNPRNHSANHFAQQAGMTKLDDIQRIKVQVYDENTDIIAQVDREIAALTLNEDYQAPVRKIADVVLPKHPYQEDSDEVVPTLSVLVSNVDDVVQLAGAEVQCYFALPNSIKRQLPQLLAMFQQYPQLLPWFPAVLIGEDYDAAAELLNALNPRCIVSNNLGVAHLATALGIEWLAGPELNITNNYALHCLQQEFHCSGAFISNEIAGFQMKQLKRPKGFRLCHSILHPLKLMTSRQCFFQQTVGCRKRKVTPSCLAKCAKQTQLHNVDGSDYRIEKLAGHYNSIYAEQHFMNLHLLAQLPTLFSDIFIDLTAINTDTQLPLNKLELVAQFQQLLQPSSRQQAMEALAQSITPTRCEQFDKGL